MAALDTSGSLFYTLHGMRPADFRLEHAGGDGPMGIGTRIGVLHSLFTGTTPALIHGNEWKHVTFSALTNALRSEGWPPVPLALPIRASGGASFSVRWAAGVRFPSFSRIHPSPHPPLVHFHSRWSDHLKGVALAFQEEHQMFLSSPDCAPTDHDCMATILEMEAERGGPELELRPVADADCTRAVPPDLTSSPPSFFCRPD